jgi:hypothetical protein
VLGSYRFDDPGGEVGLETMILETTGGEVLQVAVTYRGEPMEGAGYERWEPKTVVRGSGEPGREVPDVDHARPVDSATTTVIDAGLLEVRVLRLVDPSPAPIAFAGGDVLHGTWPGQVTPVVLASARLRSPSGQ